MSKIKSIDETSFDHNASGYNSNFDGFVVTCEDGSTVKIGIESGQCCCENWGYLVSEDDLSDFIGATITEVEVVDEALDASKVPELYEGSSMFINVETTKGKFQVVAYNEHNGYYSHNAVVVINGVTKESQSL